MILSKPEPIVVPETESKVFPHEWIYSLTIIAPTVSSGKVRFELLPYSAERKEIGPGSLVEVLETHDLFKAVQEVPEVLQAYMAILAAVEPLRSWVAVNTVKKVKPANLLNEDIAPDPSEDNPDTLDPD
jgi:hypothetical protein